MRRPDFHALCALLVATGVVISAPVWLSSTANATAYPSITAPTVVPTPQTMATNGQPVVLGTTVQVVADSATDTYARDLAVQALAEVGVSATVVTPDAATS